MMVVTLTTVGYGDVVPQGGLGRIWTALMILLGVSTAAICLSFLQAFVVSGDLRRLMGRRKLLNKIGQLGGHIIVCGYGRMGRLIANSLRERGQTVVVVESNPQGTSAMEEQGLLYVLGDATEEQTLRQAGIMQAKGLVAVLPNDAENVYVTLTSRDLRPNLKIIARAQEPGSEHQLRRAGANRVVSPQATGARMICNMIVRPHVVDFFEVAAKGVDLEMDEVVINEDSPICGQNLREANLRQVAGVMVVAIKRPDQTAVFSPGAEEVIRCGDTLILIGPAGSSAKLGSM
jgi:voltage-gated potassium channel